MSTTTLTATAQPVEVLTLTLKLREVHLEEQVHKERHIFITSMLSYQLLREKTKKEISEWDKAFNFKRAIHDICFLICTIIEPEVLVQQGVVQAKLLEFHEAATKLLGLLCEDPEVQIASYAKGLAEYTHFRSQMDAIEACFQRLMKEHCDTANKVNAEIDVQEDLLQQRLLKFQQQQKSMNSEFQQQQDALKQKFQELCDAHKLNVEQAEKTSSRIKAQVLVTSQQLNNALQLPKK